MVRPRAGNTSTSTSTHSFGLLPSRKVSTKTCQYLDLCSRNGITFNPRKFRLARPEVEFVGFKLTQSGISPSDQFLDSIRDFPCPTDITGVRSWFGLVNQASYAFSMTPVMLPFRELLKPGRPFYWDSQLARSPLQTVEGGDPREHKRGRSMLQSRSPHMPSRLTACGGD